MGGAVEVIARFGGQSALARAIGVSQSTVQYWARTGEIPSWRHGQVLEAAQASGIPLDILLGNGHHPGALDHGLAGIPSATAIRESDPAMGFVRGSVPAGTPPRAVSHGRAEFRPHTETELGALREEIASLRGLVERLAQEIAALRAESAGHGTKPGNDG